MYDVQITEKYQSNIYYDPQAKPFPQVLNITSKKKEITHSIPGNIFLKVCSPPFLSSSR